MSRDDFQPTATIANLEFRARLLREARAFFDARGFLEVETPILSRDTVVDRHLDPLEIGTTDGAAPRFLQTSPEFGMKRLIASGMAAIFQVTRAFRADEVGPLHNPEFTMVEWYRVGDAMAAGMRLLSELGDALLQRGPAEEIAYGEAFERYVGLNPHQATVGELIDVARTHRVIAPESQDADDRDAWLDLLLVEKVQPRLGVERPTILFDYPASQAALAVVRPDDPPVAERFELYVDGIELANGYHELTDAQVLRRRNRENNAWRERDGKPPLPEESRLLDAMDEGLPSCSGTALGFDRVVMLATGARLIRDVIAFPWRHA